MLEEDLRALEVFERRGLRTIFGGVQERVGGRLVWRRRMNHELAQLYGGPSTRKVTKAGRIRWVGHVVRMLDNNPAKLVFASEGPEGRRRIGGQRSKWLSQVKEDLESVGRKRYWKQAALIRVDWRRTVGQVESRGSVAP